MIFVATITPGVAIGHALTDDQQTISDSCRQKPLTRQKSHDDKVRVNLALECDSREPIKSDVDGLCVV